jgi:uncharacterized delta-60 repeat protein
LDTTLTVPGGKTLVAGTTQASVGGVPTRGVEVVQYNADGSLDSSFGSGGKVFRLFDGDNSTLVEVGGAAVTRLSTGKIMIAMSRFSSNTGNHVELVRLNANGTPDTTFASNGQTVYNASNATAGIGRWLAEAPDGKLVVGGVTTNCTGGPCYLGFYLLRFNADGTIDTTFGTNGVIDEPSTHAGVQGIVVQPDKKVVAPSRRAPSAACTSASDSLIRHSRRRG